MSIQIQIEREEARLERAYNSGEMTLAEYNDEMRELQRDARGAYEQEMEDAQARVRDEWGF